LLFKKINLKLMDRTVYVSGYQFAGGAGGGRMGVAFTKVTANLRNFKAGLFPPSSTWFSLLSSVIIFVTNKTLICLQRLLGLKQCRAITHFPN
jgi:hypothetical protein